MNISLSILFVAASAAVLLMGPVALRARAQVAQVTVTGQAPVTAISLEEAVTRAKANEPNFAVAVAASKVASLDRSIARSALLPNVIYHNQYLYTQAAHGASQSSNASALDGQSAPRFIANNAVHEYTSQGSVTETIGVQQTAEVARATAAAAVAKAELEISRRGLVAAVVGLYYGYVTEQHKVDVAGRALDEAKDFTRLTGQRENAREVAHSDVIKAQLTEQQRERDLDDARLQAEKARLDLAVLLFPDPRTAYTVVEPASPAALPSREDVEAAASRENPELQSALESLHASSLDVLSARTAYLPDLGLNFSYGIDAPEFAVNGRDGSRNPGYSAMATLDIPVWDWLATHDRVKQKLSLRDAARVALTAAQRRMVAQLDEAYNEAAVARDHLQSFDQSADAASESLRLTRLRYADGEATVLEVVDAENTFAGEENAREDGILRYQTALADLQILTGTM